MARPSSSSSAVSVSLGRGGEWGAGQVQADQSNRSSSTALHSGASCASSETGESKVRWRFHTLSHKDRESGRRKWFSLSLSLALFTNVVPGLLTTVGQFRKASDLPEPRSTHRALTAAAPGWDCFLSMAELPPARTSPLIRHTISPAQTNPHHAVHFSPTHRKGQDEADPPAARGAGGRARRELGKTGAWLSGSGPSLRASHGFLSRAFSPVTA